MKRLLLLLLTLALILCFAGCSGSPTTPPATDPPSTGESSTASTQELIRYPIGNLSFSLPKETEVSSKPSTYSFPVVPGQAFLIVSINDVSSLSVESLDGFVSVTYKSMTADYEKISTTPFSMDIAGFPATGEIFYVQEDGKLYNYNVLSFTDTYYVYTFIYMTRTDVSDSVECTLAYGDLIGNLEYVGRTPRT